MNLSSSMRAVWAAAIVSCGGKVVVDNGAGGEGTGGTTNASGSASGVDCGSLQTDLAAKIEAARACQLDANVVECGGTAFVSDTCGCQLLANENNPQAVADAQAAYTSWVNAGCGPNPCTTACAQPLAGFCASTPDGLSGVCTSVIPD